MSTASYAGDVTIVDAEAVETSPGKWNFSVTVEHGDTGWDHYADAWEVRDAKDNVLGTRILAHPHVNEQPFTRSLSGVEIPASVDDVLIFARDSVHGWNEDSLEFKLSR
ncbi:MAG: hypothetical protein AAGI92_00710 [Pseudomonadota bacterium]